MEKKKIIYILSVVILLAVIGVIFNNNSNKIETYDTYKTIQEFKGDEPLLYDDYFDFINSKLLSIQVQASLHEKGDTYQIWINCIENGSQRISSTANMSIWYPNGSIYIDNIALTQNGANVGQFLYESTTPNILGIYSIEAKCYANSEVAVAYDELQTMTTFEKIKQIYDKLYIEGDFEITSTGVNDVTFAGQDLKVLMGFEYNNGTQKTFTPDSVNLTVYLPNGSIYDNATLVDFSENNQIYLYEKSISSSPVVGKYKINIIAEKNGIVDKKGVITRISTGGPFYINLDCPGSATLNNDMYCTVEIQDEGPAPVETACILWVDLDKDRTVDGEETSASFQKLTNPGETITVDENLHIPQNNVYIGLQNIRLQCEFIDSVLPDAIATDTVSITGELTSGGGANNELEISSFTKFKEAPQSLKIFYIIIIIILIIIYFFIMKILRGNLNLKILFTLLYALIILVLRWLLF